MREQVNADAFLHDHITAIPVVSEDISDRRYHFALGSQYECGFAGLTGVPSYSQYERLLQELSVLGVQRLNIMIDSDYQDNDKVRTARDRYIELGAEAGFEVAPITWSRRQKGIDDLYKHLFRSK